MAEGQPHSPIITTRVGAGCAMLLALVLALGAGQGPCPFGFNDYLPARAAHDNGVLSSGKCFKHLPGLTWGMCKNACASSGGQQLCLRSQQESEFVRDLTGMTKDCCTWNEKVRNIH